jgi:hypothetical protein
MQGKKVFVAVKANGLSKKYKVNNQEFDGFFTNNLQTTHALEIVFAPSAYSLKAGDTITIPITIVNNGPTNFNFNHPEFPAHLVAVFIKNKKLVKQENLLFNKLAPLRPQHSLQNSIRLVVPALEKGEVIFGIAFESMFGATMNSSFVKSDIN